MNLKFILAPLIGLAIFLGYIFVEKTNQTKEIITNGFAFYENPTRHIFKSSIVFSNGLSELNQYKHDKEKYHLEKANHFFESSLGFMNQKKYEINQELFSQIIQYNNEAIDMTKRDFSINELNSLQYKYFKVLANMEQITWENVGNVYQLYVTEDDNFKSTIIIFGVVLFIFALLFTFIFHQYSRKLQHSVENFSELFNLTQEAIVIFDEQHNIVNINESAKNIFKYNEVSILGKNIFEFIPNSEIEKVTQALYQNRVSPYELNLYKSDGTLFPALASGGNIERDGKIYRLTTIVDLTALKEQEILLLQQSRLALLGEMIGNIAHQWRQPLSLITATISGLEFKQDYSKITNEDITKANQTILNAANYLSQTIDNFRNFSNQKQTVESFNISEMIQLAIDIIKASYNNNFIMLETEIDEKITYIGNRNLLSQVLLNLLGNAKDVLATSLLENKVVTLSLQLQENTIVISIKDNGGGISDDIKEKIFDPYFTTKHQSQGTGLGLYMSKQIIHQYFDGKIAACNSEDKNGYGALFTITIPINSKNEI